ncbi:MAG: DUF6268 family outer membrane beta-barrel protein [Thiobacillus sp.]
MKFKISRRTRSTVLTLALATTGVAHAQGVDWRPFLSVTPVYQGEVDLDGGGHYSAQSAMVRMGVSGDIGRGNRAGVTLSYDYTDYSFSNPVRFGNVAPWNIVQRYGVSVPLSFGLSDGWSVGLLPSVEWFRENGADAGDAFTWGGIVSATKHFDNGNRLGFGMGVFDRIEETSVFPFLLVDWRISDRWRLVNPLPAGPTGPAGLELEYRLDSSWNVGLGAAWRNARFRLSNDGPVPNGIGEERGVPVFLRATHALGEQRTLSLYAGLVTAGQLRVEDSSGNELSQVDFDTAPFFGATFSARF